VVLTRQRKLKGALGRVEAVNAQDHSPLDTTLWVLCWLCQRRQKPAFIHPNLRPVPLVLRRNLICVHPCSSVSRSLGSRRPGETKDVRQEFTPTAGGDPGPFYTR
jgi:hypothetical protein